VEGPDHKIRPSQEPRAILQLLRRAAHLSPARTCSAAFRSSLPLVESFPTVDLARAAGIVAVTSLSLYLGTKEVILFFFHQGRLPDDSCFRPPASKRLERPLFQIIGDISRHHPVSKTFLCANASGEHTSDDPARALALVGMGPQFKADAAQIFRARTNHNLQAKLGGANGLQHTRRDQPRSR